MNVSTAAARGPLFAPVRTVRSDLEDGCVLLESADPLQPYAVNLVELLDVWAQADPGHPLIAERGPEGTWVHRTYGEARAASNAIGQALLDRGLSAERPLMILSGNSIGHLLVTLGALAVGVPVAPLSVAYSLQSRDHAHLKEITRLLDPGAVYVEHADLFGPAIDAVGNGPVLLSSSGGPAEHTLDTLVSTAAGAQVDRALAAVSGDTVAKVLFTSGSTGTPKGVINTHRMLCANQQMMRQAWPFLEREQPVLVDWLPWSHTFGGNHNLNMVIANGGTLYVDDGRPVPALFSKSVANYREVAPTLSFNVPAGYAQLAPALERDKELAERFFSRMRLVFNAAAALPPALRDRLEVLGRRVSGRDIPVTGSWGATETAPAATTAHFAYGDARCIGVPLPGVTIKLVPIEDGAFEIRVGGPSVTPGYLRRPDLTAAAFDGEGYYRPDDAVSFTDVSDANAGLLFRGRLSEDFKLSTGTFVHVGALRTMLLSAAPILADAVIAGENRDAVCALAWLNTADAERALGVVPAGSEEIVHSEALAAHLAPILTAMNEGAGSAARIERLIVLARPASLDDGEITDKGYLNQRRVLTTRAALVEQLFADPAPPHAITASKGNPS
jgi:feruloyl-CoA synthase